MKSFSRRSVLRGLGAGSVLLSSMWKTVKAADPATAPARVIFLNHANGSHPAWTPTGTGAAFVLTPHLMGLEAVRNDIIIFKNLTMQRRAFGNPHKDSTMDLLGAGMDTTFDQVLADAVKTTTPLSSLELAIGNSCCGGGSAPSLSRVNGQFLPGERNPFNAYQRIADRLTGGTGPMADPMAAQNALLARKSLLDSLKDDINTFRGRIGAAEKPKMDSYLTALRELEGDMGTFVGGVPAAASCAKGTPPDAAMNFIAHVSDLPKTNRLFLDTLSLALACGITRVASMTWGGGESDEPVSFVGLGNWHGVSHDNPGSAGMQNIIKLQNYFAGEFAYFVQKLKTMGIFDSTIALWGTQNGNTTIGREDHDRHNTPFIWAGKGGGYVKSLGRLMDCGGVNHNDLYLHIARAMGVNIATVGMPAWNAGPLPGLV